MAKVVLQPLTRVEGHGRVELYLDEGRLQAVRLALVESPRLFEKLVVGRAAVEVPDLVCRICAICSAVHKLAALTALEQAMAIEVPPQARQVRELLLLGGHLQSHALHLFCLILPDFTGRTSLLELLRENDELARAGLELKAFGNRLQEVAGGRVIHPVNPVLGGVMRAPSAAELQALRCEVATWLRRWPAIAARFAETARYPEAAAVVGTPLSTGGGLGFALAGERLYLPGGDSRRAGEYAELLGEQAVAHSRAKQATGADGPFLVGALARLTLLAGRTPGYAGPGRGEGIHGNNAAQLWEIGWALRQVSALLDALAAAPAGAALRTAASAVQPGCGTALFEAPRGLLVHHYVVDDWGQVAVADIVTPTAINQRAMERQLHADLAGIASEAELRLAAEKIVRAYDPCISCAVHVLQC